MHPETEALSRLSSQLDQEAIHLNAQLDPIRKEIAVKAARNNELRRQIARAQKTIASGVPAKSKDSAASHLNRGDTLFKEKRYQEALEEFLTAAKLDPKNAIAANNAGFIYSKLQRFDESIDWTKKAIAIDPKRICTTSSTGLRTPVLTMRNISTWPQTSLTRPLCGRG